MTLYVIGKKGGKRYFLDKDELTDDLVKQLRKDGIEVEEVKSK
jgi:DNA-binding transcriptional MerR regulator